MTVVAYTDGASRGNPGQSGIGVVMKDERGTVLRTTSRAIGEATNNIAEYTALIACLADAHSLGCTKLIVHSDSELMVRQVSGRYRVKDRKLKELFLEVNRLLKAASFKFEIVHVAREENRDADRLANEGIDRGNDPTG